MSAVRIALAPRFRRAAQLELDVRSSDALQGYVVSPLAREVSRHLTREVGADEGGRAFSIIGPYGSGKSSFLTFLLRLWRWSPDAIERLRQEPDPLAVEITSELDAWKGPLVPVVVTGERAPLSLGIVRALERAGDDFWATSRNGPRILGVISAARERLEQGEIVPDSQIVEMVLTLAERVAEAKFRTEAKHQGLVLVVDEMGKFLEYAALNPLGTDLYLLQLLAERAARQPPGRVALVTVLHQEMSAYAQALPRAAREEWAKVAGRFEAIPYLESPRHLTALVAGALQVDPGTRQGLAFQLAKDTAARLRSQLPATLADSPMEACFPLDPLTAVLVGPLFRRRVAQNERSLFAFLASFEPAGFQDWLTRADTDSPDRGLFRLDNLYDYVIANMGVRGAAEPGDRTWAAAEHALTRLPTEATELSARLVKAVALLTLLGASAGLRAEESLLVSATGASEHDVQQRNLSTTLRHGFLEFSEHGRRGDPHRLARCSVPLRPTAAGPGGAPGRRAA